jgi:hypothetical protein
MVILVYDTTENVCFYITAYKKTESKECFLQLKGKISIDEEWILLLLFWITLGVISYFMPN